MGEKIRAVSFDLWDTIVSDDSDEPKRRSTGLRSKKEERRFLTWRALDRHHDIGLEEVRRAYDIVDAAFNKVWHDQHVTWPLDERLEVLLRGLRLTLPQDERADLVQQIETMEVDVPPDLIPGVKDALADLHGRYQLCIVSDAIVTPGHQLRRLLEHHGVAGYFEAFAFSDEVGRSKPDPRPFLDAAQHSGVDPREMVHVGDRQHNDIAGAQALGMKAILFVARRATDRDRTTADAICECAEDLPGVIDRLAGL